MRELIIMVKVLSALVRVIEEHSISDDGQDSSPEENNSSPWAVKQWTGQEQAGDWGLL